MSNTMTPLQAAYTDFVKKIDEVSAPQPGKTHGEVVDELFGQQDKLVAAIAANTNEVADPEFRNDVPGLIAHLKQTLKEMKSDSANELRFLLGDEGVEQFQRAIATAMLGGVAIGLLLGDTQTATALVKEQKREAEQITSGVIRDVLGEMA